MSKESVVKLVHFIMPPTHACQGITVKQPMAKLCKPISLHIHRVRSSTNKCSNLFKSVIKTMQEQFDMHGESLV